MTKISASHLARRACIYVRQSTPGQVHNNLESQRRQYALADRAKQLGWQDVDIIDDDLGCSGSGVHRAGFERLLGALCEGKVGAVLSVEASRLARNGMDWHKLLEFCSLVDALIIDAEGIYDPKQANDRLLLGMKGTISEMELASFRQRAQAAIAQKAARGELFRTVPVGYIKTDDNRLEKDPDQRVRSAIELIFAKFDELASARRAYFWFVNERIALPTVRGAGSNRTVIWQTARYHAFLSLLRNPAYAGTYVYGRSRSGVRLEQGRKRILRAKLREQAEWQVVIAHHHEGYIDWETFQRNQKVIDNNASVKGDLVQGSVKRGGALLSGLLRCGHCGAKLVTSYPGPSVIRYQCNTRILDTERSCCVQFGGLRADRLIAEQVLECVNPHGILAARAAAENLKGISDERIQQRRLACDQARYEVTRARRQYDAVDPDNRLVASELERRWNEALTNLSRLEEDLAAMEQQQIKPRAPITREALLALGEDLARLWDHPMSPPEMKKRILRTALKEIIVRSEGKTIHFILHWQGGDHTELQMEKTRTGQHRYVIDADTIGLIRSLARVQPDSMIASILNRNGYRTGHGELWTAQRVCSTRHYQSIAVYCEGEIEARGELTVKNVANRLHLSDTAVLRLIRLKRLPATQSCKHAPWVLKNTDVEAFLAAREPKPMQQTAEFDQLLLEIQ